MKRVFNLGSVAFVAGGGAAPVDLTPLPDKYMTDSYRLARMLLLFDLDITVTEGNSWDPLEKLAWINNIYARCAEETIVNIGGVYLAMFLQYAHIYGLHAGILPTASAGPIAAYDVSLALEIPIENLEAESPQDYVMPCSLFNDAEVVVTTGAFAVGGGVTVNAAQMRMWGQVERKNDVQIPAFPSIRSYNAPVFTTLAPGIYTELFAMKTDKSDIAAADITSVLMTSNGETIHGAVNADGLRMAYGFDHGVGAGGIQSVEDDDFDNLSTVLPLIWPAHAGPANKISQFVDTGPAGLAMDIQGAATALTYVQRSYKPITREGAAIKLGRMGAEAPDEVIVKRKTSSKSTVTPAQVAGSNGLRILPMKVTGASRTAALGSLAPRFQKKI